MTPEERKARRKAGIEAMTEMEKIAHAISSGRPPVSELKTPGEAIQAAKALYRDVGIRVAQTHINYRISIACIGPDLSTVSLVPYTLSNEVQARELLTGAIPLGLVYTLEDAGGVHTGAKPFLATKQVTSWLADVCDYEHTK